LASGASQSELSTIEIITTTSLLSPAMDVSPLKKKLTTNYRQEKKAKHYLCERSVQWSHTADSNSHGETQCIIEPSQDTLANQVISMQVSEIMAARDKAQASTPTDTVINFDIPSAASTS
jgi:hypothetical protein